MAVGLLHCGGRDPCGVLGGGIGMKDAEAMLYPMTEEAGQAIPGDKVVIGAFPFRVGRECRQGVVHREFQGVDRRKDRAGGIPNNDLYLLDRYELLNVSRQHFQIEKKEDGSYELVDHGSMCGTIVEGHAIGGEDKGGRCPLKDSDTITVGTSSSPFVFKFVVSSG